MNKLLLLIMVFAIMVCTASAQSVYYPAHGNGAGTLGWYNSTVALYDEGDLKIYMSKYGVRYSVQNNLGNWRYIEYTIPNPNNIIPVIKNSALVWDNYAQDTTLKYQKQNNGIKMLLSGKDTPPPGNSFSFNYKTSPNINWQNNNGEFFAFDTITGELLWKLAKPYMMDGEGKNIPLTFTRNDNTITITAPDLFTNPDYNFSAGWELDPSTQSGSTIYISDRQNLTQVSADIANASALQNLGSGEWLLNANLINNNTANSFYLNETDVTWLKINSTNTSGTPTYWYYLTNGKTEINNTKITSWNTTSNTVEDLPVSTWARSAVYASGSSSKMNISNSNLSYLGYNAANMYGVYYITSSGSQIINNNFLQNFRGIYLDSSSNNNLTSNTGTSNTNAGIYLSFSSNNNTLTSNTGTSTSSVGIYLYSSSNNTLTSNTGTSNTNVGILLHTSSNNNTLTSNTGTSNTGIGIYLYSSSNNNLTLNTFNTNSTTTTVGDILVRTSSRNNTFINTNFTKPRKIEFYDALFGEFNQSQDSGVSFVNTNVSIARTTNRSIINWNQTNITFTETFTGVAQANYSVNGLIPNSDYRIYNGSVNDFNLTTNMNGVLPDFKINFSTVVRIVQILQQDFTIPVITSWGNNYTNNQNISFTIPKFTTVLFNTTVNPAADWHWTGTTYISGNGTINSQADNYFDSMGTHIVSVYASSDVGNSNTITWTITVLPGCCFNISGYVTNVIELPLQDARIDLNNSHVFTDAVGYYEFTGIEEGTYPVLGRAIGYRNYTDTLDIAGNTTENITLNERTFGTVTTPGFSAISGIFIIAVTLILIRTKKRSD